jgi:predicted amidohydrolase
MVVSPWGEVLVDAGTKQGITHIEIDVREVSKARRRIPALTHDVDYRGP